MSTIHMSIISMSIKYVKLHEEYLSVCVYIYIYMTHLPQLHSAPFGFGQKLEVSSCKLLSSLPFGSSCQVFGIKGTKKNEFTERS